MSGTKRACSRPRIGGLALVLAAFGAVGPAVASDATSFVPPDNWTVGDSFSTYQEWDIFVSSFGNPPDVGYVTDPPIADPPTCSVLPPGFLSSSNNFYAFAGDYTVEAVIFNHGGAAPAGHGTIVRVQFASTLNPDFSAGVIVESLELRTVDDEAIPGGAYAEACLAELLYSGPAVIGGPFGDVLQDEWLVQFWLPDFRDDFIIRMPCYVHATFLAVRVDTLNVATPFCDVLDINCDCRVDTDDALGLMANLAGPDVGTPPPGGDPAEFDRADLDLDGDVDLRDCAQFQASFPH